MAQLSWTTENVTIKVIALQVRDGSYDLDPPHQRDVVHVGKWRSDLVNTVMTIGMVPPTLWHTRGRKTESIDGKQRISALVSYLNNEFNWNGRKFDELTEDEQIRFENHSLTLMKCTRTLTDDEISSLFSKLQVTKKTTAGEVLNSNVNSSIRNKIFSMLNDEKYAHIIKKLYKYHGDQEKYNKSMKRYENADILLQLLHMYHYSDRKITPAKIETFLQDEARKIDFSEEIMENAFTLLSLITKIVEEHCESNPHMTDNKFIATLYKDSVLGPFILFLKDEHKNNVNELDRKARFLVENLSNTITAWGDVGGSHNSASERCDEIENIYALCKHNF